MKLPVFIIVHHILYVFISLAKGGVDPHFQPLKFLLHFHGDVFDLTVICQCEVRFRVIYGICIVNTSIAVSVGYWHENKSRAV